MLSRRLVPLRHRRHLGRRSGRRGGRRRPARHRTSGGRPSSRSASAVGREVFLEGIVRVLLFPDGAGRALGRRPRRRNAAGLTGDGHGAGK